MWLLPKATCAHIWPAALGPLTVFWGWQKTFCSYRNLSRKLKYSVRKLVIIRKLFSMVLEQKLYIQYGRSHYSVRFEFYTNNFFLVYRINTLRCSVFFFLVTLYNLMPQEKFIYFIFVYMVYVFDQESIQSYFNLCSYTHKDQIYKKSLYLLLRVYW